MPEESTTPDLEEAARRSREALSRGDLDAAVAMYAPDAVWDVSLLGLKDVFEGREAIRGALEDLITPYEDLEVVAEEFRDLGTGVTVVVFLVRGRLRGSTGFVESRMASVATWANGLIERATNYPDIDQARAAAERLAEERGYAVSQENVERVQRLYEYLNQGDIDAALALLDPGVEWWTREDTLDTEIAKRREGWRARWAEITGVLEELHLEPTEVIDAGEYVVVCVHQVARTRGVLIDQHEVHVFRLRDGLVIELREFHEKRQALKAIGQEG